MDKIRNLSVRKTILLYMAVSLLCSFLLSALIVGIANRTQEEIWWNYVDEEKYFEMAQKEDGIYMVNVPRPASSSMTKADHTVSEICDFLQTYTVLLVSIIGSCAAVLLFYRNKLKDPIEELEQASQKIAANDLDFHITYENRDEMGRLCQEFERMRKQVAENNRKLWKNIEDEKALRAAISHDIRSPLSVLRGYQEMLLEYLPDQTIDTGRAVEMLEESMKQVERMDVFIETMRKMSSLEERKLTAGPITAEQLKNEMQAELEILEKASAKQSILQVMDSEEIFYGDKEVILEVVENLLSNALRYAKKQIEVTIQVTYFELRVSVTDDGSGFQENAEQVTKAFYQQNVKDSLKHAGMGMYLARLYCEKHGGRLILENRQGKGAAVTAVFGRIV